MVAFAFSSGPTPRMQSFPQIDRGPLRGNPPGEADDVPVPDHGIVAPVHDLPVVREEEIRIAVQFCHCLIITGNHRVTGHIGTGHNEQRVFQVREEKVVKSGIGQHAADRMEIADCCMGSRITFFQDNDRVDRAFQDLFFLLRNDASRSI